MIDRLAGYPVGCLGSKIFLSAVVQTGVLLGVAAAQEVHPVTGKPWTGTALTVHRSPITGLATFVTAANGGTIRVVSPRGKTRIEPMDFLRQYGRRFGVTQPDRQLVLVRRWTDAFGHEHSEYQQVHEDVPVFSGVLKVHQNARGEVTAANGDFYPIKRKIDVTPTLTVEDAVASATARIHRGQPVLEQAKLVLVDPGWYGDPPAGVHLAYHLVLTDLPAGVREAFFVDAHTGEVLDQWTLLHTARYREIYTGASTGDLPGTLIRSEGEDPVEQLDEVNRAYDYYGDTYDYFFRAFGRDSLDDEGLTLIATVESRAIGCPNAFWSSALLQAAFCKLTVVDDIVAHELTHGVMFFTAQLVYQNQPGQLNESFSDVFGELVDLFNGDAAFAGEPVGPAWPPHETGPGIDTPNFLRTACSPNGQGYPDGVRWLVGEDATAFGGAVRDMWDPTCKGHPDRANSPLQTCNPFDSGGVHSGSGVPNHAFAILTDGATFNGYTITGIGPIKAAAVWYRALTTYLNPASDFQDAYLAFNQSASDLVGTFPNDPRTGKPSADEFSADDAQQVDLALMAVEMNTPGLCGQAVNVLNSAPAPPCVARAPIYADDFESGIDGWTLSNTAPPTPYDWILTTEPLPFDRPGVAWFCADPDLGDCQDQDESGVHSLLSPTLLLPLDADFPAASWTHLVVTEMGWDGGHVRIRVNGGPWQLIPGTAFTFNPYNSIIRSPIYGNTNPLAGQEGWTGIGGRWGTSQVDLSGFASGGDTIQLRFDFGKDGCTGITGWFVDDFEVYDCPDCNLNGVPDAREFIFTGASGPLGNIGVDSPQSFLLTSPPRAAGDVTLSLSAIADLGLSDETIEVDINGTSVGTVFAVGAQDCPLTPNAGSLVVSADDFNEAVNQGDVVIGLTAAEMVNPRLCLGGSFVKVFIEYQAEALDQDDNGLLDVCENCAVPVAPQSDPSAVLHSRYLALVPSGAEGRLTALRVTLTDLPSALEDIEGQQRWVGLPFEFLDRTIPPTPATAAPLSCEPVFLDWASVNLVYVFGAEIVPEGTYHVQSVDLACHAAAAEQDFSAALTIPTGRWGDVSGPDRQPDGAVNFTDIGGVVDRFKQITDAPATVLADLYPALPDQKINFSDIGRCVEAFKEVPYQPRGLPICAPANEESIAP